MSEDEPVRPARVWRLRAGALREEEAALIAEEPFEVFVDGELYAAVMRTPGDDLALAVGLCLAEGLVDGERDLASVSGCEQAERNRVFVTRSGPRAGERPIDSNRRLPAVSSCGPGGRAMIEELAATAKRRLPEYQVSTDSLLAMGRKLAQAQKHFRTTGGTHAAAIFDSEGEMLSLGEDVGRHNALDKAIGRLLLEGGLEKARAALLSGRCGFEMVQKVVRAGIPLVASVSAPTHLAVELAARAGVSLVGFVRETELTVYVDHGRIADLER